MLSTSLGRGIAARSRKVSKQRQRIQKLQAKAKAKKDLQDTNSSGLTTQPNNKGSTTDSKPLLCLPFCLLGKCRRSAKKCRYNHAANCICNRVLLEAVLAENNFLTPNQASNSSKAVSTTGTAAEKQSLVFGRLSADPGVRNFLRHPSVTVQRLLEISAGNTPKQVDHLSAQSTQQFGLKLQRAVAAFQVLRKAEQERERERRKRVRKLKNSKKVNADTDTETSESGNTSQVPDERGQPTSSAAVPNTVNASSASVAVTVSSKEKVKVDKYRKIKRKLWSKWDQGIQMPDPESWYSCCPEAEAIAIARCCTAIARQTVATKTSTSTRTGDLPIRILDAFCGVGGNAIRFAKQGPNVMVVAADIDLAKLVAAKHNANVYGVQRGIDFVVADFGLFIACFF